MAFDRRDRHMRTEYDRPGGERPQVPAAGWAPAPDSWPQPEVASEGGRSLTVTKVLAGGLAAASSAVCGSYFGVLGTVGGAAAGSVVTALSTEIYQRAFDRARDHFRPSAGTRGAPGRPSFYRSAGYRPARAARRRFLPSLVIVSLVVFAVAMGAVSGIEWARGEPLSGGSHGTSVGHLFSGGVGSTVDGLLGGGSASSNGDTGHGRSGESNDDSGHGLVGGLVSGLTGN
jgi:hypothetical protein